jgi:hypothetical protein
MYQKPVIDHCPWPLSQFNKWHAQNKLLSSSLIVIGSSPWFTPPHTSEPLSPQGLYIINFVHFFHWFCKGNLVHNQLQNESIFILPMRGQSSIHCGVFVHQCMVTDRSSYQLRCSGCDSYLVEQFQWVNIWINTSLVSESVKLRQCQRLPPFATVSWTRNSERF